MKTGASESTRSTGTLFILSAPSGAGKTTLRNALLKRFPDMRYSISHTTRPPRAGESPGADYHFIDPSLFQEGIAENRWAEWAEVHSHYYGTAADFIDHGIAAGTDILLDIDVQGTLKLLKRYPDAVTVFVLPPSMDVLRHRLESRETDSREEIERRLAAAEKEMDAVPHYRHVVTNDDLSSTIDALATIVKSYATTNLEP